MPARRYGATNSHDRLGQKPAGSWRKTIEGNVRDWWKTLEGRARQPAKPERIPNVAYHRFAEMIGLRGIYVDDPEQLGAAWDQALASDIPVVLEVKTDPEVPPLPPHITLQQARNFSIALAKGDPDEVGMIRGAARQVLESILPDRD